MKGYCPSCGKVIDEVEYTQFKGVCEVCSIKKITVKHRSLLIKRGNVDYFYVCNTVEWNYWLDRYYPKAECILEVVHNGRNKDAIGSEPLG